MSESSGARYPQIDPKPDLPEIERRILAHWDTDDTFQASVDQRPPTDEFVFYDGPPKRRGLLLGYAGFGDREIRHAAATLGRVLPHA